MIDKLAVILRSDTCETFAFRLRYSELLESFLYVVRNVIPVALHTLFRTDICYDSVHVKTAYIGSPLRHFRPVVYFKRAEPELRHPCVVSLFGRYLAYYIGCYAAVEKAALVLFIAEIVERAVDIRDLCFFFHPAPPSYILFKAVRGYFVYQLRTALDGYLTVGNDMCFVNGQSF